jgi:hypothetical protein
MITELKIYSFDASGFVTQSYDVDLFESISIPVTKSIVDIKEPDQRKSDFTKTITIPGTANNNQLFSSIFNLDRATINSTRYNYQPDFNPNLKVEAILFRNSIPQIQGYMQLTGIRINDGAIEYDCVIIGKFANMFQDLGDLKLTDLDLSEFNHTWNRTNIVNSWETSIIKNGTTYVNFSSGNPNGVGYVYPLIDRYNSIALQEIVYPLQTSMYPAIYVKQIVDSIFKQAGYRYSSSFFNSQRFKNLIVPFCGGNYRMSGAEVEDRDFEMSNSTDLSFTSSNAFKSQIFKINLDTNSNDTNPSGVDTSAHWWQCPTSLNGKYRFGLTGVMRISGTGSSLDEIKITYGVKVNRGSQIITVVENSFIGKLDDFTNINLESDLFDVKSGDQAFMFMRYEGWKTFSGTTRIDLYNVVFDSGFAFFSNPEPIYQEGQLIDISSSLTDKVKQADFLKYLIKSFNLYVEVDPIDKKKFIIEPRDEFYTNDIVDFTPYLDVSKDIQISPMGLLDFKTFEMKYKEDEDELNKRYQDVYREPFSTQRFNIINDFIKETKTIDIGFSASPLKDSPSLTDRIFTKIRPKDPPTDSSELPVFNIRILQYGGLVDTYNSWAIQDVSGLTYYNSFPYAGMLDNVDVPTFSLECTTAKAYFYGVTPAITTANLYNSYWAKTINEITDKDSKLVTAYFHLTPLQMSNLSFRKYYKIHNQYYRLNKVDYDLNSTDPIQIEFLKLKVAPAFIPESTTTNGGEATFTPEQPGIPEFDLPMLFKKSNEEFLGSRENTYTDIEYTNEQFVFTDFTQKIWLVDGSSRTYLPDATLQKPKTGYPIIIIHNQNGVDIDIYPIGNQLIGSESSFKLKRKHTAWFAPYDGKWVVIMNNNTNE